MTYGTYRAYAQLPEQLRGIKPRVKQLFCRGEWRKGLFGRCVAVVGSRRMTSYGERVLERIIPVLVEAEVTIVSGFMYGVDQAAQKMCLECGGKTIAVLGWGIDWQMANGDRLMAEEIIKTGGLIVSEWENQAPQLWMFPQRNRIIAGLSQATLVVEAAQKSGSLITADWAKKFKRKLLAVPGPVTSKVSVGTNQLIKTGEAEMVQSGEEILEALGWAAPTPNIGPMSPIRLISPILVLLETEPLTVDEVAKKLGKSVEEVGAELSVLVLQGKIREEEGKFYVSQG